MFKSKVLPIVLVLLIIGGVVFYKKYPVHKMGNEIAYLMQITSGQTPPPAPANKTAKNSAVVPPPPLPKLFGTLIITSGVPNSQDMANGLLCLENAKNLEKVDLFMPDMGHGSEPPKVTPIGVPEEFSKYNKTGSNFGCYSVESMQLFMPGSWQVRVFYKDGIIGIFSINLDK